MNEGVSYLEVTIMSSIILSFVNVACIEHTISQTLKLLYNARAYIIMRASYDSIDNKQNVCGKINFSNPLHFETTI